MLLALVIFFVLVEAVFTALEIAIGAVPRARLRSLAETEPDAKPWELTRARRAQRTLQILEDAPRLTLIFIIVTSLSLWITASLLTRIALVEGWPVWALPLALTGVLFGAEVLPVLIAAPRAEDVALRGGALIEAASTLLAPLIWLTGSAGRGAANLLGANRAATPQVTEEELRSALAAAEEEGAIESGERALLEGAMDFRAKLVREVMTPRLDIIGVPAEASLPEVLEIALTEGHSRLPVYESTLDKVIGIASSKDLLSHLQNTTASTLTARDIIRPVFFVPENKRIAATLDDLRRQRTLMGIVVDDDGATAGLVTLEDLLEEIVGDIQDETDQEEPELEVLLPDSSEEEPPPALRAIAYVTVRDCERFWEKSFGQTMALRDENGEDADDTISLAALALHLFDGVPEVGDRVVAGAIETGSAQQESESLSVELEILTMNGPRIEQVKLQQIAAVEEADLSDSSESKT